MVYSGGMTPRSFVKTAALCTLGVSVLFSTHAEAAARPPASSITPCGVSDDDQSSGIRAVDDSTCVKGGLGCYNDHCRFCKVLDTPQSTHFQSCSSLGAVFPTVAPLVAPTTLCQVSSGDAAVGISAVTDPDCLYGGLGCFQSHCRFCKVKTTPQSAGFIPCSSFDISASVPVQSTKAPVVATEAPIVTTEAPAVTTAAPIASTETPVSTTAAPASPATCNLVPAVGDVAVGVGIATDPSCQSGGLGCISDICRFCKVTTSVQSAAYIDCALIEGVAPVSEAPTVTAAPASDISTEAPDVTTNSADSTTDAPVTTTEAPIMDTEAPISTADAPVVTTEAPVLTTEAPVPTTDAPAPQSSCSLVAAAGDAAAGINIVTDPTCQSGGVGCIDDICRFCKVTTSVQSAAFIDCALLDGGEPTSEPPTASTAPPPDLVTETPDWATDAPDSTTEAPVSITEAPISTTETPGWTTDAPDAATDASVSTTEAPDATTDAPMSTTESPVAQPTCSIVAAAGDVAVGVSIATDLSCSSGGVGCINDVCRFCKVRTSIQSAAFVDCASIMGATAASEAPTVTADLTTDVPAPTTCSLVTSSGDASVGISIGTDPTCSLGGVGCINDVCRFCKMTTSTQSASFVDCTSIADASPSSEAPIDTTPSPTDPTTDPPAPQPSCSLVGSEGDAAVGINVVSDASCRLGGIGCIDDVCRFCKVTTSVQSASFVDCASIVGATLSTKAPADSTAAPSVDPTTSAPVPQASCSLVVSEGDAGVGINIVADASCRFGGIGCIDEVCRFCKVTTSVQSAAFVDCASIAKPATSSEAPTASPPSANNGDSTTTPDTPDATTPDATTPDATTPDVTPDATSDAGDVATDAPSATDAITTGGPTAATDATTDSPTDAPADTPDATEAPDSTPTDAPNAASDTVDGPDSNAIDTTASYDSGDDTDAPDHPSDPTDTPTDALNTTTDATDAPGEMDTPTAATTPGATTADASDTTTTTGTTDAPVDAPGGLSPDAKDGSDDFWDTDVPDDASDASSGSTDFDLDF